MEDADAGKGDKVASLATSSDELVG